MEMDFLDGFQLTAGTDESTMTFCNTIVLEVPVEPAMTVCVFVALESIRLK